MTSNLTELMQRSETEFLEFRQRIKESIRNKTQNGSDIAPTLESGQRKRKLPYNEFGSFFGPSQPGIASRVLLESKPLLKDDLLAAKMINSIQTKKSSGPTSGSEANEQLKRKAEKLKESRDYSFLFSDDAELPVSIKEPPSSLKAPIPNSRPSSKGSQTNRLRLDSSGSKMRSRPGSSSDGQAKTRDVSQTHKPSSKLGPHRPATARKPDSVHSTSKPLTSGPKQQSAEQRNVSNEHKSSSQMVPRQHALAPSKHRVISKPTLNQTHQLKKKKKVSEEDEQAFRMLREICNTDRFAGRDLEDYDDSDMEASLEDIIKEERRSEKIAKKEDAEQLRLIEEEKRRERVMRKGEKKPKLSHEIIY